MTQCPHCLRKFKHTTADRHIPHCATMKHKPKPPPTKDEVKKKEEKRRLTHLKATQGSPTGYASNTKIGLMGSPKHGASPNHGYSP